MANHICFTVADRSYFSLLKKEIHNIVTKAGFNEHKAGQVDIVVAEIVTNLVKHAGGGKLLVKMVQEDEIHGVELISIDNGIGIGDLNRMMVDGVSTKNSLGQGLGAMQRISDLFQIYSQKGWGTVLLARIFTDPLPYKKKRNEIRSLVLPITGEEKSGDGFYCEVTPDHVRIFSGDGLGHGEAASVAVNEAINAFKVCREESAAAIINYIHQSVRKTRGLVGMAAVFSFKEKIWRLCGVGNIASRVINGIDTKNHLSYNGIIGHNIPTRLNDTEIPFQVGQTMIMCSDGIKTRWDHTKYPTILKYDLSILAAVIFKDFGRFTDDMSVGAIKLNF